MPEVRRVTTESRREGRSGRGDRDRRSSQGGKDAKGDKDARRLKGIPRREVGEALERVLATCGLDHVRDRLLGHLSKGYRQRVGLAQALIHDPPVLVLDEPTIGLDPRQIRDIRALVRTLGGKRTIVLSTHILSEVTEVCDKVVIINDGRVALEDQLANMTRDGRKLEDIFIDTISREAPAAAATGA